VTGQTGNHTYLSCRNLILEERENFNIALQKSGGVAIARLEEIIPKISPIIPFFYSQRIFLLFFQEEKLFPRMLPIILKQINVNAG